MQKQHPEDILVWQNPQAITSEVILNALHSTGKSKTYCSGTDASTLGTFQGRKLSFANPNRKGCSRLRSRKK